MYIQQISIFVQNKSGRLSQITQLLGEQGINIHALSISDTPDYGILRMIVSDPFSAEKSLKDSGLKVATTDVIGISISHTPGGLAKALQAIHNKGISVEYMYAFAGSRENTAMVILKVDDNDKAVRVLKDAGITVVDESVVKTL